MGKTDSFYQQSFISIDQIQSLTQVEDLFAKAELMKEMVENKTVYEPLLGYCVAILFYQPSTRTFSSFSTAARRLGAYTTAIHGMEEYSSVSKGETLPDTIRSIYQTTGADVIVLRHPDDDSSEVAAKFSPVPVVNAGSGKREHPTQALLDLFTIQQNLGRMDNLHVVMVGDMLYGRTIKSLAKLLTVVGKKNKVTFVAPDELKTPKALVLELTKRGMKVQETTDLTEVISSADVLYMTRVQKEWFEAANKIDEYERLKLKYILTQKLVKQMKKDAIVMHPLPRVGEIEEVVDIDIRAKYFVQMRSGLYVRMALLESILLG